MRFTFSAEQSLFAETVRACLAKECTPTHVREAWDSATGRSEARWRKLAALGVTGLTVPVRYGGLGLDELDLVRILEEAGRAGLPEPIVETVAVGAPLLAALGTDELNERWLPAVATGDALLTIAFEAQPFVTDAHVARLVLYQRGGELHALEPDRVRLQPQASLDRARRLFSVEAATDSTTRIATGAIASDALSLGFDRGALGVAAELLGVASRMIDQTAEYARERQQFGKPIGSFQAVKHHLANALVALERARPVVYRSAWSVARADPAREVHVSMAKAYASEAASLAAGVALQVHGAIGYTEECDLHLWMKRAWALVASWGDASWHRGRVATAVLGDGA